MLNSFPMPHIGWRVLSLPEPLSSAAPSLLAFCLTLFMLTCACSNQRSPVVGYPPLDLDLKVSRRGADNAPMSFVNSGTSLHGSTRDDVEYASLLCQKNASQSCERQWFEAELPQRSELLPPFWIDRFEVTNAQFQTCISSGGCPAREEAACQRWVNRVWQPVSEAEALARSFGRPDQPVVCVTWVDAVAYCAWAGKRLPTANEWEKASRGPSAWLYPWGFDLPTCERAQMSSGDVPGCGTEATVNVGSFPDVQSPFGLFDVSGNAAEWVQSDAGEGGGVRGGSWRSAAMALRPAAVGSFPAGHANIYTGFRCAMTPSSY